ncbi:MAG: CarD family transcriptional regulator, partial [Armatimonadota bacterium]
MRTLTELLHDCREYRQLMEMVTSRGKCVAAEGASGAGKALLVAAAFLRTGRTCLVVTYNHEQASRLVTDLQAFASRGPDEPGDVRLLPATESVIYDGAAPEPHLRAERLDAVDRLLSGSPTLVVTTINAALQLMAPADAVRQHQFMIEVGDEVDRQDLLEHLIAAGYRRENLVDDMGQFSARGGVIDVFPPTRQHPVRMEFFGDQVESIRQFDLETQRSAMHLNSLTIGPAGEVPLTRSVAARAAPIIRNALQRETARLRRAEHIAEAERWVARVEGDLERIETLQPVHAIEHYLPYLYERLDCVLDYLPEDALLVIDEPVRLKSHADQYEAEVKQAYQTRVRRGEVLKLPYVACLSLDQLTQRFGNRAQICLTMLARDVPWAPGAPSLRFATPPVDSFGGQLDLLVEGIREWQKTRHRVVVSTPQVRRITQMLGHRGLKCTPLNDAEGLAPNRVHLARLPLSSGFKLPAANLVVLTDSEIFGWQKLRRPKRRRFQSGITVTSLSELAPGDYVVHINHGVGIYEGLVKQTVQGVERDYLLIKY